MGDAAFWGLVTTSSLIIGALVAILLTPPRRVVGLVLGFGAGALISAVAYDLLGESTLDNETAGVGVYLVVGALAFILGDAWIDRAGGSNRKGGSIHDSGGGQAIVLGTVLDGIPESFVIGLTLIGGDVSVAFVAAVFVSNLPESVGATVSLKSSGRSTKAIMTMWVCLVLISTLVAVFGYTIFDSNPHLTGTRFESFAAGSMLAMLADTMMPEAITQGGRWAGLATVFGFIFAFVLHTYD